MAGSCEFRTSEASAKAWLRTRSVIDKYLNILNVGQFRIFNRELSELAEEKFGVLSKTNNTRLFEEERIGNRYVAVPNKEVFKAIDNAKGIFYQQPGDVTQQAIPELDKFLLDFIQKFGVSVNEINNFKERFGVDALGATDILNKAIYYATNRNAETIPEEFGHMITMIMGKGNPDMAALMDNIEQWEGYQAVYDQYMPVYKSVKKVKFEAVGKLLAKSLVKNFGVKEKPTPTLLEKILNVINSFLNKVTKFKTGKIMQSTNALADKIATNVLLGNVEYISSLKPTGVKVNPQKALQENPFAEKLISDFTNANVRASLTGSIVIALQGVDVYRKESEPIHDLDFQLNEGDQQFNELVMPILIEKNAKYLHYGIDHDTYETKSFLIPKEGLFIDNIVRNNYGKIIRFDLVNAFGERVPKVLSENYMVVDFFVTKTPGLSPSTKYVNVSDIFLGKLKLSKEQDEVLFSREKDEMDYNLANGPFNLESDSSMIYFQLESEIKNNTKDFSYALTQIENSNLNNEVKNYLKQNVQTLINIDRQLSKSEQGYTLKGKVVKRVTDWVDNDLGFGFPDSKDTVFEETANIRWGNIVDKMLELIIEGKSKEEVLEMLSKDPKISTYKSSLSEQALDNAYNGLKAFVDKYQKNYIILSQVSVFNEEAGIAGTADIVLMSKTTGALSVKDLKTSVKESKYWVKQKKERYAAQITAYSTMLKAFDFEINDSLMGVIPAHLSEVNEETETVNKVMFEAEMTLPVSGTVYDAIYTSEYKTEEEEKSDSKLDDILITIKVALQKKINSLKKQSRSTVSFELGRFTNLLNEIQRLRRIESSHKFINSIYEEFVSKIVNDSETDFYAYKGKLRTILSRIKKKDNPLSIINDFYLMKSEVDMFKYAVEDLKRFKTELLKKESGVLEEMGYGKKQIEEVVENLKKIDEILKVADDVQYSFKEQIAPLLATELSKYITGEADQNTIDKIESLQREIDRLEDRVESSSGKAKTKFEKDLKKAMIELEKVREKLPTKENIQNQLTNGLFEDISSAVLNSTSAINSSNIILSSFAKMIKTNILEADSKAYSDMQSLSDLFIELKNSRGYTTAEEFNRQMVENTTIVKYGSHIYTETKEDVAFVRDRDYNKFFLAFQEMQEQAKLIKNITDRNKFFANWVYTHMEAIDKDIFETSASGEQVFLQKSTQRLLNELKNSFVSNKEYDLWYKKNVVKLDNGLEVITDINYLKPRKEFYQNDKYERLSSDPQMFTYYNKLLATYFESQSRTPNNNQMKHSLPNISKSFGNRAAEEGLMSATKHSYDKTFKRDSEERARLYGDDMEIPVPFLGEVKPENKSLDLFTSINMYNQASYLYEGRNEMRFVSQALEEVLQNSDVIVTSSIGEKVMDNAAKILKKNRAIRGNVYSTVKGGNIADFFTEYIEKHIFGVNDVEQEFNVFGKTFEANKLAANVTRFIALTQMGGLKIAPALAQRLQGAVLNRIEAYAGQYVSRSSWLKATLEYTKHSGLEEIKDFNNPLRKSLIGQLIDIYNPFQQSFGDKFGQNINGSYAQKLAQTDTFFFLMRQAENPKAIMMLAQLEEKKINLKDGTEISLLDAYEMGEDGKIKFKDEVDTSGLDLLPNSLVDKKVKLKTDAVNKGIHGIMNDMDQPNYKRYWYGKVLYFYRNWVIPGFQKRWRSYYYDNELEEGAEGHYRTFFRAMYKDYQEVTTLAMDTFRTDKQSKFTTFEKYQIRKTAIEFAFIMATGALVMLLAALKEGADDDKEKAVIANLLYYTMRLNSELSFYGGLGDPRKGVIVPPVGDMFKMLSQPSFVLPYVFKVKNLLAQMGDPTEEYTRATGIWEKGDLKLYAKMYSLIPLLPNGLSAEEMIKVLQLQTK
jgi:hypothetical protein